MSRPPSPRVPTRPQVPRDRRPASAVAGPAPHRYTTTDAAPRWVSGLLAGAQGALLSLLAVTTPALAAWVATSADPSNADVGWSRSVAVGAVLWLMGHGASIDAAGVGVTLVPLGITLLALFGGYASARRSAHRTSSAWLAGIGGYVLVVAAVVVLTGATGPLGAGVGSVLRTTFGTVIVAAVGLGAGVVRMRRLTAVTRPAWTRVPAVVRLGVTGGVIVVGSLVGVSALVTTAWVLAGRAVTDDVITGLGVDTFGGVVLAFAQLAVLPNLVLWVLAWVAGPGFAVGAGTLYSPAVVISGPLPALPLLGALPPVGSEGGPLRLVPLVVVLAGAVAGWWLHRRLTASSAWPCLAAVCCTGAGAGLLAAVVTAVAGGSAGPGRLTVVGGAPLLVGAAVAGLTLAGAALTAIPMDVHVRAAVGLWARAGWRRLRGQADAGQAGPGHLDAGQAGPGHLDHGQAGPAT